MNRRSNGTFAPGTSGNPGGRPRALADVQEAARAHTELAIGTLARIMADESAPPAARASAAQALLDRAWGKPAQQINQDLTMRQPSPADFRPDLQGIRARIMASGTTRSDDDETIN
jgi:hypothetical protein